MLHKKSLTALLILPLVFLLYTQAYSLEANTEYSVEIYTVTNDGVEELKDTLQVTSDSNGKIQEEISKPTDKATMIVKIKNAKKETLRMSTSPTKGTNTYVGITKATTAQTKTLQKAGSYDPIGYAFMLIILRSGELEDKDLDIYAEIIDHAVLTKSNDGSLNGFIETLKIKHSDKIETFRANLLANTSATKKDLTKYVSALGDSMKNNNENKRYEAGAMIGNIFIDAATTAKIPVSDILESLKAAEKIVFNDTDLLAKQMNLSQAAENATSAAFDAFFKTIEQKVTQQEIKDSLDSFGTDEKTKTKVLEAIALFEKNHSDIDVEYGQFYEDPTTYLKKKNKQKDDIIEEINKKYDTAWANYRKSLDASNEEIIDFKETFSSNKGKTIYEMGEAFGETSLQSDTIQRDLNKNGHNLTDKEATALFDALKKNNILETAKNSKTYVKKNIFPKSSSFTIKDLGTLGNIINNSEPSDDLKHSLIDNVLKTSKGNFGNRQSIRTVEGKAEPTLVQHNMSTLEIIGLKWLIKNSNDELDYNYSENTTALKYNKDHHNAGNVMKGFDFSDEENPKEKTKKHDHGFNESENVKYMKIFEQIREDLEIIKQTDDLTRKKIENEEDDISKQDTLLEKADKEKKEYRLLLNKNLKGVTATDDEINKFIEFINKTL